MPLRRRVWVFVIGACGLYALYALALVLLHPRIIYPFDSTPFEGSSFRKSIVAVDGRPPVSVFVNRAPDDAPVVLYFMGNIGALGYFAPMLDHHDGQERQVVAMGYRGGGGLPGFPSEAALKADALAVFDALPDILGRSPDRVVAQGYSLGSGLAVHLAAHRPIAGVVLSAPYARLCDLMATASGVPACLLPWVQTWRSDQEARHVSASTLILHGDRDSLVPLSQGRKLAASMTHPDADLRFVVVAGAGHTDLLTTAPYLTEIDTFIDAIARRGN